MADWLVLRLSKLEIQANVFIYNAVAPHLIGLSVWLDKLAHVYAM